MTTSDQERAAPAQQPVADERAKEKFKLWFFRDIFDEHRHALFRLFEMPVDEIGKTHGHQRIALNRILQLLASEPELRAEIVRLQAEVADERYLRIEAAKRWEAAESRVEALSAEVGTARAEAFEEAAQIAETIRDENYAKHGKWYGNLRSSIATAIRIRSRAALDKGATR